MAKLKVGIIGTGGISVAHIEGYQKHPDAELYALCDINRERVASMAARFGIPPQRAFTDKSEMLRRLPELDAVSVCTWNSEHAPCSIAALKAGKHVLCEKPMAINAREALAMQKAAEVAGKLLMIGFVRRHGNDARLVKDFVDSGQFGDVYYAKAAYLRRNGNPGGWFGDKARAGGGPLIDLGVHVIDFVRYVIGNPQPVSVYGATFHKLGNRANLKTTKGYLASDANPAAREKCDVEDLATALVRFDNGTVLSVEASFSLNIKNGRGDIELFGTRAGGRLDPKLEIFSEINGYMVNVNFDHDTSLSFSGLFDAEIYHFVECALGRAACIAPAEDGVVLMRILDAIYESAATGHEVRLGKPARSAKRKGAGK